MYYFGSRFGPIFDDYFATDPDENYAQEIMQLYTVGIEKLSK